MGIYCQICKRKVNRRTMSAITQEQRDVFLFKWGLDMSGGKRVCRLHIGVPEDAPNGREWHLSDIGGRGFRRNAPDVSESTLDETVLIPGALLE